MQFIEQELDLSGFECGDGHDCLDGQDHISKMLQNCTRCETKLSSDEIDLNIGTCIKCKENEILNTCMCGESITGDEVVALNMLQLETSTCYACHFKHLKIECSCGDPISLDEHQCSRIGGLNPMCTRCLIKTEIAVCECGERVFAIFAIFNTIEQNRNLSDENYKLKCGACLNLDQYLDN